MPDKVHSSQSALAILAIMEIIVRPTAKEVGVSAADIIEPFVRDGATLGLATGSTPNRTYMELARRHREPGDRP